MKRMKIALIGMLLFSLIACNEKVSVEDLKKFAATETYPFDKEFFRVIK
ncbi:MAG: hypothetical protein MUC31_01100 [Bacteroidales bacterium]|jgi:hypothetical protein|nr:hypothetical protein [Bacteroidales bacterium]